jgi:hypothetical protein
VWISTNHKQARKCVILQDDLKNRARSRPDTIINMIQVLAKKMSINSLTVSFINALIYSLIKPT